MLLIETVKTKSHRKHIVNKKKASEKLLGSSGLKAESFRRDADC